MKKLDFLPNRQNKYSIRKFTVGTASILLGTLLITGAGEEAKAAETNTADQSTQSTTDTQTKETANTAGTTADTQRANNTQTNDSSNVASTQPASNTASSTSTKTTDAPSQSDSQPQAATTDKATSNSTTPKASPAPESSSTETTEQPKEKTQDTTTDAPKADTTVNQASETNTAQDSTTKKTPEQAPTNSDAKSSSNVNADSQRTQSNSTTEANNNKVDNNTMNNTVESAQNTPAPSDSTAQQSVTPAADTSNTATPEVSKTPAPTNAFTNDVSQSLSGATDKSQALTDYLSTQDNLSPEAAQQVVDGLGVDLSTASNEEISNALLASYLKNTQNAPGSNPVAEAVAQPTSTTEQRSPQSKMLMRSFTLAAPAPATQVSNWNDYVAAMNNTSVSNIELTGDVTATSNATLASGAGRQVTIDGGGHTIDTGNYYINAPANSGNWDITYNDTNIKTNNINGLINFAPSTTTTQNLTFNNVNHTGNNLVDNVGVNNNLTVNIQGDFSSTSSDNATARANIGAKNINIAPDANVSVTRNGLGNAFQVADNGSITTGTGSTVNVDVSTANPWGVTNGNTAFQSGNNVKVQLGDNSTTNVKGQNIFNFGNNATLNTGEGSTVNVDQKGNGNIVNMGTGSTFEVAKDAKFIANSDGHRVGDWQSNNLIGLDGNSQILVDEGSTLFVNAVNHQWNPDTQTQVGAYNDLVNINATGNQSALLHVADNATLDLRSDNRDYYAELISIPLGGTNPDRRFIFDNAYYVNLQKMSTVTSGESKNGSKPNLIFMDPGSPGYIQWNGSYIAKTWNPTHFSDPNQSADADNVWEDVVDLRAEQKGFNTGIPTYDVEQSTPTSTTGTPLSELNLNYDQRLVLISNNSDNPEAVPPATTTEEIPPGTTYQPNPDPTKPVGDKTVITPGTPGEKTVTTEPGKDPVEVITTPPTDEVVGVNNQSTETTPIPHDTINRYNPDLPVGSKDVVVQEGKDGSKTTTTTYDVDPKTGELTNPKTTTETTPPVDRITEYGPVDGDTVYEPDPNLPVGETETTPGTPGDPNDPNNPPTDTVVHVGNTKTETTPIPHEATYVGVDEPVGYTNVQTPGKDGSTTTKTTYDVDPKTGELTNPKTTTTTTDPVTQVNEVGTKQVAQEQVPFETITRYNPDLPAGTQNEIQPGIVGENQTTTTYTVNPTTGELENPTSTTETITPKQDRIIEVGTGGTSIVTNEIPPETTYQPNPDPTKPVGDKTVITPGVPGEETVTTEPGKDPVTEVTTPPTNEVIGVNNQTTETTPIPHDTINRYNPDLPVGSKDVVVQEGKDGSKTTTTTYDVDPKTGELTNPKTTTETTPPEDRITEYGPVDGGTVYEPDPNLPVGETETTPGKPGDPNDPNNPPTDTVVHVGNKTTETTQQKQHQFHTTQLIATTQIYQ